ncbi:MAG: hypothetical protein CMO74_00385 [Verrucomicrobiales bacterium]|nr:hypothetical protein [Verrucomicrobiales bacterium]HCU87939.1 hypothetical protein [Verrucomicrobiales bacterium]|tara:strand:+ start:630 stop:1556 length:927 start_codon:yes stop_codon:yes gene_type:complete
MRELVWLLFLAVASLEAAVSGDAQIRAQAGPSEIVITTTSRLAGAIHSLKWNGREFIDSTDHGRQLQSASNFDAGSRFVPETFNPTEAGSRFDGAGPKSSSVLLELTAKGRVLSTQSQMAFWLKPGEKSFGNPAKNTTIVSKHLLKKTVTLGVHGLPHAIGYDVTFTIPKTEHHRYAQFEVVTGYMPRVFSKFWSFDLTTNKLSPLSDGPGEQSRPVIFSTPDAKHAMAVWSAQQPSKGFEQAGYGRFRFKAEQVVKWNCVFRETHPTRLSAGNYSYRSYVLVGSLKNVTETMNALHRRYLQIIPDKN